MKIKIEYLEEDKDKNEIETKSNIAFYIFGIQIKKLKINRNIHGNNNLDKISNNIYMIIKQIIMANQSKEIVKVTTKILKIMRIEKLDLKLGINLQDPLINAYSIALLNAALPMYLANQHIVESNLKYETFISQNIIYLDVKTTINTPIFKNIINIIQLILIFQKAKIKKE